MQIPVIIYIANRINDIYIQSGEVIETEVKLDNDDKFDDNMAKLLAMVIKDIIDSMDNSHTLVNVYADFVKLYWENVDLTKEYETYDCPIFRVSYYKNGWQMWYIYEQTNLRKIMYEYKLLY